MNIFTILSLATAFKPTKYSKAIKEQTKKLHDEVEAHTFFRKLVTGELEDKKYLIYLFNMLPIYELIENDIINASGNVELVRSPRVLKDIESYENFLKLKVDGSHFFNLLWIKQYEAKTLIEKKAHLYVCWLADMYGGQILKTKVRFNQKYQFKNLRKNIKLTRELIEQGIDDKNLNKFIREANKAFELSRNLVNAIEKNVK